MQQKMKKHLLASDIWSRFRKTTTSKYNNSCPIVVYHQRFKSKIFQMEGRLFQVHVSEKLYVLSYSCFPYNVRKTQTQL